MTAQSAAGPIPGWIAGLPSHLPSRGESSGRPSIRSAPQPSGAWPSAQDLAQTGDAGCSSRQVDSAAKLRLQDSPSLSYVPLYLVDQSLWLMEPPLGP